MTDTLPPTPGSPVRAEASPAVANLTDGPRRGVWPTVSIPSSRISIGQLQELAGHVVTGDGSGEVLVVEQPFTGQPLGEVPRSNLADVDLALRARPCSARVVEVHELPRAPGSPPALPRSGTQPAGRAARSDPTRDRQGTPSRRSKRCSTSRWCRVTTLTLQSITYAHIAVVVQFPCSQRRGSTTIPWVWWD